MNCKVIACYFGERKEYPSNQKEAVSVLRDVVENEKTLSPGVPQLDTILVNHDCGMKYGNGYLNYIDGEETYAGTIRVLNRPWDNGVGASFGSFNWAFEELRDEYDYWFFQEDDYKIIYDHYYARGIKMLVNDSDLGFVGYDRGSKTDRMYNLDNIFNYFNEVVLKTIPKEIVNRYYNDIEIAKHKTNSILQSLDNNDLCHGGMGLTHRSILDVIYEEEGSLPYFDKPNPGVDNKKEYELWWWLFVLLGEIQFSNIYHKYNKKVRLFNQTKDKLIYTYKGKTTR